MYYIMILNTQVLFLQLSSFLYWLLLWLLWGIGFVSGRSSYTRALRRRRWGTCSRATRRFLFRLAKRTRTAAATTRNTTTTRMFKTFRRAFGYRGVVVSSRATKRFRLVKRTRSTTATTRKTNSDTRRQVDKQWRRQAESETCSYRRIKLIST